ncbi:MAG: AmmeMemoRadiSam system protein B, partial [candidate division Zixibacteria bacterium]|nr:AmmeMemoRadiSam system protein B [candidate division Zixibacteria bacterium]NIR67607.1 AmmeMemoRadiSam system protein B [candidate division Zixibacteria bacterium]NIS16614.1 AmmeMemoRadiSam system protein B [candidate division Zixibacteria bacterium]NIS48869.1 AmmeMemoRadiSam system protein B [candidate division Zixibacteria bacterium]NIT52981.1 AmmeMemoRadiSam system protein B [candidate division Zixibacteria bacterium]
NAAESYKLLSRYPEINTVIILGFKHQIDYRGVAIWASGKWKTPLGEIPVNEELAAEILNTADYIADRHDLFSGEHSLETQIPFLQVVAPKISIVPLQIGAQDKDIVTKLTNTLSKILKERENYVIIASTDMTHYKTRRQCAAIDSVSARYITNIDGEGLWSASENGRAQLCGAATVAVALEVAKKLGADKAKILKHSDSGEYAGNTQSVVSYLSAVVYKSGDGSDAGNAALTGENYLSGKQQQKLMEIARKSIEAYLDNQPVPEFDINDSILEAPGAAFVTINKDHQLRGCIGYTEPILPLYQTVSTCAVKAASEDPRFQPLQKAEYPHIELEISVLTPLKKIEDVSKIEVGKHGLMMQRGYNRGLLLPQVAVDYGWNRMQFLDATCRKAGMPPGCWKENCDIYIFSAEVFEEK